MERKWSAFLIYVRNRDKYHSLYQDTIKFLPKDSFGDFFMA